MMQNRKTAIRILFLLFQLTMIAIAVRTRGEITIGSFWPKQHNEYYLHWWLTEYISPNTWSKWYDVFAIVSSILFAVAIATIAELAYKRGEVSGQQIFLCFLLIGSIHFAVEFALCLLFEHYYRWWLLIWPESLAVSLLVLSEIIEKNRRKQKNTYKKSTA